MPRMHFHINVDELQDLWHAGWTGPELAKRYNVSVGYVYMLRHKYRLRNRRAISVQREAYEAPSAEDAAASEDSLRLSPWVQARIKELRLGMPA